MRCVAFFFFKQKTAYEMRISDWSSDVCSSDLSDDEIRHHRQFAAAAQCIARDCGDPWLAGGDDHLAGPVGEEIFAVEFSVAFVSHLLDVRASSEGFLASGDDGAALAVILVVRRDSLNQIREHLHIQSVKRLRTVERDERSEEHTSELQSLMRISYAVFCLKKKQH